jgi:UMP-CMP kinase
MHSAGKSFGYARLRVTHLLRAEVATGSSLGATIHTALTACRTVPIDATLAVIRNAIARSPAKKFLIDGFPRVVSDGFPSVQDQVFAFEDAVAPIRGVVVLDVSLDERTKRVLSGGTGVLTPGQQKQLAASTEAFVREKSKILQFFEKLGKVVKIDTTGTDVDGVFAAARSALQ